MIAAAAPAQVADPLHYIPPLDEFGLPASPMLFVFLILVTQFLHVLFMNFTLGGACIAVLLDILAVLRLGHHDHVTRIIWHVLPVTLSFTITTGVAPLLFVQVLYGSFFYPATVFLGATWLALVPTLIIAFYMTYALSHRLTHVLSNRLGRWDRKPGHRLVLAVPAALLFVSVAWILTSLHSLSIQPEAWPEQGAWSQNRVLITPSVTVPRFLHNLGGAIAVAGVFVAAIGWWRRWRGTDPAPIALLITETGLWVAVPMIVFAAIAGPIFFFAMSEAARSALLVPGILPFLWWMALAGVGAQLFFGVIAIRRPERFRWFAGLSACMIFTLFGMLAAREQVRLAYLGRSLVGFSPDHWHVRPQASSIVLFAIMLLAAVTTVIWLVRTFIKADRSAPTRA